MKFDTPKMRNEFQYFIVKYPHSKELMIFITFEKDKKLMYLWILPFFYLLRTHLVEKYILFRDYS